LDFLRSLEAGQSALVLFQCMWQSSEDAGLSTSPDSWLHLNKRLFAAVHESAFGTKRTYRGKRSLVRFRGEADIRSGVASIASVVDDPKRTLSGRFWCDAALTCYT